MRSTLHGFASLRTPSGRARNRRGIALVAALLSIAAAVAALASWLRGPGFEAPPIRCGMRSAVFEVQCVDRSPYLLVNDINAAVKAAEAAGGEIAHPPMEVPGHGTFAIFIQGGIQHGLWQR